MTTFDQQLQKIKNDKGFIAALDQSGGSTPKALKLYGVNEDCVVERARDVRRRPRDAHRASLRARLSAASA